MIGLKNTSTVMSLPPIPQISGGSGSVGTDETKQNKVVVKEAACFNDYIDTSPIPHTHFSNLLYVYPTSIIMQKHRNISCKIQFRASESDPCLRSRYNNNMDIRPTQQTLATLINNLGIPVCMCFIPVCFHCDNISMCMYE